MSWIDWLIVVIPVALLVRVAVYSRKFVRGVADYLVAGRVAGRYVLSVGDCMAALSVITLVAETEKYYQTGFVVGFWWAICMPVIIFISLSGFCVYRWRQTRCLSFGQFIELRYGSKFFRIFCAVVRTMAEMITNAIGPAIAANFFIYYLGLPHKVMICGVNLPCYVIVVTLCLTMALVFILPGGRISLLITDCIQGLFSYPIFVMIVGYIILYFSWWDDIAPVMWNRVPGQSFMNPFDVSGFRDFNIFALIVTILGSILNRASWIGNDATGAGRTPHEQKMAGILGTFRNGMGTVMSLLLGIVVITFMNSPKFAAENSRFKVTSTQIRQDLTAKILGEVVPDAQVRSSVMTNVKKIETAYTAEDWQKPMSQSNNPDTPYFNAVKGSLGGSPEGRAQFQEFRSLYNQMIMPTVMDRIFPVGMVGLFCLLMIMLLISTDDSRLFNASSTLTQDIVLPLFKGKVEPGLHLWLLRGMSLLVAGFFFLMALLFSQLDYIIMFITIMSAVWLGGAAPIMLGGLYTRFGNLVGAWCAVIFGCGTSFLGLILQRTWVGSVYPFLEANGWVEPLNNFLVTVSSPFNPWVVWSMNAHKFPINSYEIYFISTVLGISTYIIGSCLTYKPYNLDKLLHRGEYADADTPPPPMEKWSVGTVFRKLIGITPEYSKGDRIIAYSMFVYSFVYGFLVLFVVIAVWNVISPWPHSWWNMKFFLTSLIIPGVIGIISTVWFLIGGIVDLRRLFRDLKARAEDPDDNGQVFENKK